MKAFRFFAMLAMAATLTISFNSCDKDDDDEGVKWVQTNTIMGVTMSISDLKDDGKSLTCSSKTEFMGEWSIFTLNLTYDKDGNITGQKTMNEFSSKESAQEEYEICNEDDEDWDYYESVTITGNTVTCVYNDGEFDYETKDEFVSEYNKEVKAIKEGKLSF